MGVPHFSHSHGCCFCRCGSAEQPGLLPRLLDDLFSIKAREFWRSEIHFDAWLKGKTMGKRMGKGHDVILACDVVIIWLATRKCSDLELRVENS